MLPHLSQRKQFLKIKDSSTYRNDTGGPLARRKISLSSTKDHIRTFHKTKPLQESLAFTSHIDHISTDRRHVVKDTRHNFNSLSLSSCLRVSLVHSISSSCPRDASEINSLWDERLVFIYLKAESIKRQRDKLYLTLRSNRKLFFLIKLATLV